VNDGSAITAASTLPYSIAATAVAAVPIDVTLTGVRRQAVPQQQ
jgi:hypothetical protein